MLSPPVKIDFKIRRFPGPKYENTMHCDAYLAHQLLSDTFTTIVTWFKRGRNRKTIEQILEARHYHLRAAP